MVLNIVSESDIQNAALANSASDDDRTVDASDRVSRRGDKRVIIITLIPAVLEYQILILQFGVLISKCIARCSEDHHGKDIDFLCVEYVREQNELLRLDLICEEESIMKPATIAFLSDIQDTFTPIVLAPVIRENMAMRLGQKTRLNTDVAMLRPWTEGFESPHMLALIASRVIGLVVPDPVFESTAKKIFDDPLLPFVALIPSLSSSVLCIRSSAYIVESPIEIPANIGAPSFIRLSTGRAAQFWDSWDTLTRTLQRRTDPACDVLREHWSKNLCYPPQPHSRATPFSLTPTYDYRLTNTSISATLATLLPVRLNKFVARLLTPPTPLGISFVNSDLTATPSPSIQAKQTLRAITAQQYPLFRLFLEQHRALVLCISDPVVAGVVPVALSNSGFFNVQTFSLRQTEQLAVLLLLAPESETLIQLCGSFMCTSRIIRFDRRDQSLDGALAALMSAESQKRPLGTMFPICIAEDEVYVRQLSLTEARDTLNGRASRDSIVSPEHILSNDEPLSLFMSLAETEPLSRSSEKRTLAMNIMSVRDWIGCFSVCMSEVQRTPEKIVPAAIQPAAPSNTTLLLSPHITAPLLARLRGSTLVSSVLNRIVMMAERTMPPPNPVQDLMKCPDNYFQTVNEPVKLPPSPSGRNFLTQELSQVNSAASLVSIFRRAMGEWLRKRGNPDTAIARNISLSDIVLGTVFLGRQQDHYPQIIDATAVRAAPKPRTRKQRKAPHPLPDHVILCGKTDDLPTARDQLLDRLQLPQYSRSIVKELLSSNDFQADIYEKLLEERVSSMVDLPQPFAQSYFPSQVTRGILSLAFTSNTHQAFAFECPCPHMSALTPVPPPRRSPGLFMYQRMSTIIDRIQAVIARHVSQQAVNRRLGITIPCQTLQPAHLMAMQSLRECVSSIASPSLPEISMTQPVRRVAPTSASTELERSLVIPVAGSDIITAPITQNEPAGSARPPAEEVAMSDECQPSENESLEARLARIYVHVAPPCSADYVSSIRTPHQYLAPPQRQSAVRRGAEAIEKAFRDAPLTTQAIGLFSISKKSASDLLVLSHNFAEVLDHATTNKGQLEPEMVELSRKWICVAAKCAVVLYSDNNKSNYSVPNVASFLLLDHWSAISRSGQ